jgi:hypothetical protein
LHFVGQLFNQVLDIDDVIRGGGEVDGEEFEAVFGFIEEKHLAWRNAVSLLRYQQAKKNYVGSGRLTSPMHCALNS